MALSDHQSAKADIIAMVVPHWRLLVGALLWEIVDNVPPGTVLWDVRKWFIRFDITIEEFAKGVEIVFGPRPS